MTRVTGSLVPATIVPIVSVKPVLTQFMASAGACRPAMSATKPPSERVREAVMVILLDWRMIPQNVRVLGSDHARHQLVRGVPLGRQIAADLDAARQRMADDILGELGRRDELVEIDAGLDAHLLAHENQIFGAHIAGRALVG